MDLKIKINQYFIDIIKLASKGIYLDSFTFHFANYFKNKEITINTADVHNKIKMRILILYSSITISKFFGIDDCQLNMKERIEIALVKLFRLLNFINKNIEIYGVYRYKAKTHKYKKRQY